MIKAKLEAFLEQDDIFKNLDLSKLKDPGNPKKRKKK